MPTEMNPCLYREREREGEGGGERERGGGRERERRDTSFSIFNQTGIDVTTHSDGPSLLTASLGRRPGTRGPSVSKLLRNWMVFTTKAFTWCETEAGF